MYTHILVYPHAHLRTCQFLVQKSSVTGMSNVRASPVIIACQSVVFVKEKMCKSIKKLRWPGVEPGSTGKNV